MTLNPIFALEVRARWRSGRSFLLLLGVVLALGLVAGFVYQRSVVDAGDLPIDPMTGMAVAASPLNSVGAGAVGRQLFLTLAYTNIAAWLFIAAASAATGIARERERGLLESLQLSRMSAAGQIWARFGAQMLLLGALQLVLLPVYGIAFQMGGVAPAEIAGAFALALWSAVLGTGVGLWFSARSHRPTGALFGALGLLGLLSGGAFYWIFSTMYLSRWAFGAINWDALWPTLLHPSGLLWALTDPTPKWALSASALVGRSSAIWAAICGVLLWSAIRNVNRTLPPPVWGNGSVWVEKLKQRQAAAPSQSKAKQRASGALLADLPLDKLVHFSDPLLAREVKSRFRLRRAGFWLGLVRFGLFLGAVVLWLLMVFSFFDKASRGDMAMVGLNLLLYLGTLILAVLSATSWTRERESGTWESLKLSLLSPRQILRAKWLSPLVSLAYYAAPIWVLLPISALYTDAGAFVAGAFVIVAWLGLAVALGLWLSWRVRNGTAAIAWAVGLLALILIGAPAINSLAGVDGLLAKQRFGVSGNQDSYSFTPFTFGASGQPVNEKLRQRYQSETGRTAPTTYVANPIVVGQSVSVPPEWNEFQRWGSDQIQSAEAYKRQLSAWHPSETLSNLFSRSQRERSFSFSERDNVPASSLRDLLGTIGASVLAPALVTLLLLVLLRYDVRREQLNA